MDTIGKRLKEWRKEKGLTLLEIQQKTGLSTGGMSAYERDEKLIGSKTLLALYSEYQIDIAYILTGNKSGELTTDEQRLIDLYRQADERGKRTIIRHAESESMELSSSISKLG